MQPEQHWHARPGTWDAAIARQVVAGEYGTLDFRGKVVLDIGAHIGGFSVLAARNGARRVVACEPEPGNAELLRHNVAPFPQCEVREVAVWRSDVALEDDLSWAPSENAVNTGGGGVYEERLPNGPRTLVKPLAFDRLLDDLGVVDLLKLDCEGSEYPILLTSQRLGLVREIVGEWHDVPMQLNGSAGADWNPIGLFAALVEAGFEVTHSPLGVRLGKFHARRPS